VHADSKFTTAAIPRLGIPQRWLSDGPHGVREDIGPHDWNPAGRTDDFATWLPVGVALAATWDPELTVPLGADAFAFYDPAKKAWVAEAGEFRIRVGSSSRHIRFEVPFTLESTTTVAR
jgi:hypothetical protein